MALNCAGLRPSFHIIYQILTIFYIISRHQIFSESNKHYHMSTLCVKDRFHPLSKQIDGAVITSSGETNMNCTITFQTESVLQRFMLKFEELGLGCHDHLFLFDGDRTSGESKVDLSCRSTKEDTGLIFTNSNFITLKYITDKWTNNGFTLVITAIKDGPEIECRLFKCSNFHCISQDLLCDGVDHCGDNSDESSHARCYTDEEDIGIVFGVTTDVFIGIMISVFLMCLACVLSLAACLCKREQELYGIGSEYGAYSFSHPSPQAILAQQANTPILPHTASYTANVGGSINDSRNRFATLPLEKVREKPPPYPGNMYTPATGNNVSKNTGIPMNQVVYYTTK